MTDNTVTIERDDAIRGYESRVSELIETAQSEIEEAVNDWSSRSYRSSVHQGLRQAQTAIAEALRCIGKLEEFGALKSKFWSASND